MHKLFKTKKYEIWKKNSSYKRHTVKTPSMHWFYQRCENFIPKKDKNTIFFIWCHWWWFAQNKLKILRIWPDNFVTKFFLFGIKNQIFSDLSSFSLTELCGRKFFVWFSLFPHKLMKSASIELSSFCLYHKSSIYLKFVPKFCFPKVLWA